jgi:hypothetical protein
MGRRLTIQGGLGVGHDMKTNVRCDMGEATVGKAGFLSLRISYEQEQKSAGPIAEHT